MGNRYLNKAFIPRALINNSSCMHRFLPIIYFQCSPNRYKIYVGTLKASLQSQIDCLSDPGSYFLVLFIEIDFPILSAVCHELFI